MEIFKLLKNEHNKILALFGRLEKTKNYYLTERRYLFSQLESLLINYLQIKEKVFYSSLKDNQLISNMIYDSIKTSRTIQKSLYDISIVQFDKLGWLSEISELKKLFHNHIIKEENNLYNTAYELLTGKQMKDMANQFETEKEQFARQNHKISA